MAVPIKIRCSQLVDLEPKVESSRAQDIWHELAPRDKLAAIHDVVSGMGAPGLPDGPQPPADTSAGESGSL